MHIGLLFIVKFYIYVKYNNVYNVIALSTIMKFDLIGIEEQYLN